MKSDPTQKLSTPIISHRIDLVAVFLITLAIYVPVLWTGFSPIDDYAMLRDNNGFANPSVGGFWKQLTQPQHNIYAPLTYAIWYLIGLFSYADGQVNVIGFKLASWIIHAATAAAAWWAIGRIVPQRMAALIGALIVVIHPIQVESVAWTTGLKDQLCALFSFIAIGFYLKYLTEKGRLNWSIAILASLLAIASKPTAVVLPAILLAADVLMRQTRVKKRIRDIAPVFIVAAMSVFITWNAQQAIDVPSQPLHLRPLIAADSVAFYIRQIFLPLQFEVDYARSPLAVLQSGSIAWIIAAAIFLLVGASRDRRIWIVGLIFLLPILPVSGLVTFDMQQYSTVADHYASQSMLAIGLLAAMAMARWKPLRWAGIAIVILLATQSIYRQLAWQDLRGLFAGNVKRVPSAILARGGLISLAFERKDVVGVENVARQIITIRPNVVAYDNLAMALVYQDRFTDAADAAKKALGYQSSRITVARAQQMLKLAEQVKDHQLARMSVNHWIMLEPDNALPRQILADLDDRIR